MTSYYFGDKQVSIGAVHSDSIFVYWSHKFIQRSRDIIVTSSWRHQLIHHFNLKRCYIIMAQWLFYSLNSAFTDVCGKALFFIRTFYMFERFFFTRCVGFNIRTHLGIVSILERYTSRPSDLWTLILGRHFHHQHHHHHRHRWMLLVDLPALAPHDR